MTDLALALRQVRYENRAFWRNPAAAFFTFAFPLILMVIFNLLLGGNEPGQQYGPAYFFTPAIIAFSVISACFTNIAMNVTIARDAGVLKRVRGTPLPGWAFLAGRILHAVLIALLLVLIVAVFGLVVYGVEIPLARLPALLITLAVGAATFCALGLAISGFIPNADAAPAVVNAAILPLLFISNVFIRLDDAPAWLETLSRAFPVRHFADALLTAYDPQTPGAGLEPIALVVMALWGIGGIMVAAHFFSWEPRT
ncbi:MAG: ABC transporter permease [Chloroflexi bacterium]|nr:ABC transporter permease [Chloroflexota bacterium]